jgi:hypothetical protein
MFVLWKINRRDKSTGIKPCGSDSSRRLFSHNWVSPNSFLRMETSRELLCCPLLDGADSDYGICDRFYPWRIILKRVKFCEGTLAFPHDKQEPALRYRLQVYQSTRDTYALSSNPTSIVRTEKNCGSGDILRFSYSTHWCHRCNPIANLLSDEGQLVQSFGLDHAWIDRVDSNSRAAGRLFSRRFVT